MKYMVKKCLIVAGLIAIGSDGAVSEHELVLMNTFLRKNGVSAEEEKLILSEITPRLGSVAEKGKLFREVVQTLTMDERKVILRYCCRLILSDMAIGKNEVKTLKQIGSVMSIPGSGIQAIIDTETTGT